MKHTLNWCILC